MFFMYYYHYDYDRYDGETWNSEEILCIAEKSNNSTYIDNAVMMARMVITFKRLLTVYFLAMVRNQ